MIELILIILIILVVVTVSIIAWTDYNKHKKSNETDFTKVGTDIKTEGATRLSNLKYVVDQVNKTNEDMDTTYTKKFSELDASMSNYTNFKTGFGSLISVRGSNVNNIDITNPTMRSTITDVDMIKRVSFLGGVTIKDLEKGGKSLEICGTGTTPSCIRLPNSDGDTYLTSLKTGNKVVFGAPVKADEQVDFYKSVNLYNGANAPTPTLSLQATDQGASLNVKDTLSIKSGTNEFMGIGLGGIMVNGNVTLRSASGITTATLSIGDDGVLKVGNNKVAYVTTTGDSRTDNINDGGGNIFEMQQQQQIQQTFDALAFCTNPSNQGKNFKCTDVPESEAYFQLLGNTVLPYNNWNQAVQNAANTDKITLTAESIPGENCTNIENKCTVGSTLPKYDEKLVV